MWANILGTFMKHLGRNERVVRFMGNPCCGYMKPLKIKEEVLDFDQLDFDFLSDFDKSCLVFCLYKEFHDLIPYECLPKWGNSFLSLDKSGEYKLTEIDKKIYEFCKNTDLKQVRKKCYILTLAMIEDSRECPFDDYLEKMNFYIKKMNQICGTKRKLMHSEIEVVNEQKKLSTFGKDMLLMVRGKYILELVNQSKCKLNQDERAL